MRETDAAEIIAVLIVKCELARIFKVERILKMAPRPEAWPRCWNEIQNDRKFQ